MENVEIQTRFAQQIKECLLTENRLGQHGGTERSARSLGNDKRCAVDLMETRGIVCVGLELALQPVVQGLAGYAADV
jgi:hypothetical protein